MLGSVDERRLHEERAPIVWEERRRTLRTTSWRARDALAFARRVLRILSPRRVNVALYEGRFDLRVEHGRDWSGAPDHRWAMVAIPAGESPERIAWVLAELAGVAHVPYLVDTLIAAAEVD
jgi:hypothetical protein